MRALVAGLAILLAPTNLLAAPPTEPEQQALPPTHARVEGQLHEAGGSRALVSGATVLLVDAPADVRPGKPARTPLDPETLIWTLETETDEAGRFTLTDVPVGKVRVVVVAGGYERLEQWAEVGSDGVTLELYLDPEASGEYRTEVVVDRERLIPPTHSLDAAQARHYAGGGDDPVLVALNLPGAARTPGGFGLLSLRGGNPTETGVYVDGHPVPRAFHILPVASVLSPPMTGRVEVSPGNYGPNFGSFSAGLVEIFSRTGRRDGIHGESHLDLFDLGTTLEGPVGDGSVHFGLRRSHVDGVLLGVEEIIGPTGIMLPNYWDYLGRFDYPVVDGHTLTLRAIGAGDRLRGRGPDPVPGENPNLFEFAASFHRFDLDYRIEAGRWKALISPSIRLDSARLEQDLLVRRDATVFSGRIEVEHRVREWLTLSFGTDLVYEKWRRRERVAQEVGGDIANPDELAQDQEFDDQTIRLGVWFATKFTARDWTFVPSLRANVFNGVFRLDPRLDVRGQVHESVAIFARLGMFSRPVVINSGGVSSNLITQEGVIFDGIADVPDYLISFFDPGIDGEIRDGSIGATYAIHASTGVEAALPWELDLRGTLFWREVLSTSIPITFADGTETTQHSPRYRSAGFELLLRRALGPKLDGWIGYTLMWAQRQFISEAEPAPDWIPAIFDQRHNFVVLLSFTLPRNFRFGARFRLVSGNPEDPVLAGELASWDLQGTYYRPIRGEFGSRYQPMFHQLDLRLDKRWVRDRTTVSVYLDVQNVYNHMYAEVPVYTRDWSQRSSLLGLPIFPSLGVQVEY